MLCANAMLLLCRAAPMAPMPTKEQQNTYTHTTKRNDTKRTQTESKYVKNVRSIFRATTHIQNIRQKETFAHLKVQQSHQKGSEHFQIVVSLSYHLFVILS